jgi:hypothetical protein
MANNCMRWRGIFEGLLQDGGREELAENLRASPFSKGLSIDTTFTQIHLDEQYLSFRR